MPRTTHAGRGVVAIGYLGLALIVLSLASSSIARLTTVQPQPGYVAARERLALLEIAVRAGRTDQADALAGSLAAGLGVDTPVEIAPELTRFSQATSVQNRELAIVRAGAILDHLARLPRSAPPWIHIAALLAAIAGVIATSLAMAALQRSIRQTQRESLLLQLRIEQPPKQARRLPDEPTDSHPDFGRIVTITTVEGP